jgi:hypothetical protein
VVKLRFRKEKKEQEMKTGQDGVSVSDLERLCGGDKEVCEALEHTMFYDPRKIPTSLEDAAAKAADFEKAGDEQQARVWYHVAGGLALWKGDAVKVKQYFEKCAALAPELSYKRIVSIPQKAVEKAQEFYKEHLK